MRPSINVSLLYFGPDARYLQPNPVTGITLCSRSLTKPYPRTSAQKHVPSISDFSSWMKSNSDMTVRKPTALFSPLQLTGGRLKSKQPLLPLAWARLTVSEVFRNRSMLHIPIILAESRHLTQHTWKVSKELHDYTNSKIYNKNVGFESVNPTVEQWVLYEVVWLQQETKFHKGHLTSNIFCKLWGTGDVQFDLYIYHFLTRYFNIFISSCNSYTCYHFPAGHSLCVNHELFLGLLSVFNRLLDQERCQLLSYVLDSLQSSSCQSHLL